MHARVRLDAGVDATRGAKSKRHTCRGVCLQRYSLGSEE